MSMEKGNGKRRLWEFQPFTICRILGLSFDERRLKRIFKELKLNLDNQFSADFEMHQSLAQICRTQSQPAKRVEKMLEKQFAPYKNEVERLDAQKISAIIEGSTENTLTNVPIPALIWFAVRNGGQDKELETRIFAAIHMKEHLALRFYDELALKLPGSKVEDITKQLEIAFESNEKLQRRCERLEQKKEKLISIRDRIKTDKIRLIHELEEQKRLTGRFQEQLKEIGGEAAYVQIEGLKKELEFLRSERKQLNKENAELLKINSHYACRLVKEACKLRDKPCHFLRSSGLSALKRGLLKVGSDGSA